MKHFKTLIKLKQREVDALRKQMGALQEKRLLLDQLMAALANDLENEVKLAGSLVEMGVFFGDYSEGIKEKQGMVQQKIDKLDQQMTVISDKMMDVYGEQKKYETVHQRKLAELAYQDEQRQQQFLDEQAALRQRRIEDYRD